MHAFEPALFAFSSVQYARVTHISRLRSCGFPATTHGRSSSRCPTDEEAYAPSSLERIAQRHTRRAFTALGTCNTRFHSNDASSMLVPIDATARNRIQQQQQQQ